MKACFIPSVGPIYSGKFQRNKLEFIKNPSVLEFLGLPSNSGYSEAAIEEAIINHLQQFILGILLCADTDIARYSILKGNEHLFATKYKLYLPTESQLRKEIEREKEIIRLQLSREKG